MFIWYSKWIITDNLTAKSSTVSSDRASECYHNSVIRSSYQRCSIKKVFFLILQNSQENTCARVSFFNKVGIRNIWSSIHEKGKQRSDWVASLKALLIKESVYFKIETIEIDRRAELINSSLEVFLGKGILKICSKFIRKHPCRNAIAIKLQSNFIEITFWHGCSLANLLHIFRTSFPKNTSGVCFWIKVSGSPLAVVCFLAKVIEPVATR